MKLNIAKKMSTTAAALAAFALLGSIGSRPAQADSTAAALLKPYVQWAQTKPTGYGTYGIQVVMVSNQPNQVASYAEDGFLLYEDTWVWRSRQTALGTIFYQYHLIGFSGDSTQYFNDRRYYSGLISYPFDPSKTDKLGINIDATAGSVTFTSWGSTQETADLHATNGMLIGTTNGGATVIISLKKQFYSIPK